MVHIKAAAAILLVFIPIRFTLHWYTKMKDVKNIPMLNIKLSL